MHLLTDRQIDFVWVRRKIEKKFEKKISEWNCWAFYWPCAQPHSGQWWGSRRGWILEMEKLMPPSCFRFKMWSLARRPFKWSIQKVMLRVSTQNQLYFSARNVQRFFAGWKGSYSHCASNARRPRTGRRGFGTIYRGIFTDFCSFLLFLVELPIRLEISNRQRR